MPSNNSIRKQIETLQVSCVNVRRCFISFKCAFFFPFTHYCIACLIIFIHACFLYGSKRVAHSRSILVFILKRPQENELKIFDNECWLLTRILNFKIVCLIYISCYEWNFLKICKWSWDSSLDLEYDFIATLFTLLFDWFGF